MEWQNGKSDFTLMSQAATRRKTKKNNEERKKGKKGQEHI